MLLANKTAIVYGAGDIGGAVARAFAEEGARVFVVGRTPARASEVAASIRSKGGSAEAMAVDAFDQEAVDRQAASVVAAANGIDITFHAIDLGDAQGAHVVDTPMAKLMLPIEAAMKTQVAIARAVTPHMAKRGRGVIMGITANVARIAIPNVAGFAIACAATESLYRQLAVELGPLGIRVVCLRSAGSPDSRGLRAAFDLRAAESGITREAFEARVAADIPLRRLPRVAEIASVAKLMASDNASAVTGAVVNVTCGSLVD